MTRKLICLFLLSASAVGFAEEAWPAILNRMPVAPNVTQLTRTNCASVILGAFSSNATVKALIFLPGATDELYFFKRVRATLTNANLSLLDAVVALTNQTPLRVTFQPPFLLLYTDEDVLAPNNTMQHEATGEKLKQARPVPHLLFLDRDWDQVLQVIRKPVPATLQPYRRSSESWHFYRHTFAGWNLSPWEILEATALAGKSQFTVRRGKVVFEVDPRVGALPKLEQFPR
jgi:hypothetical protein